MQNFGKGMWRGAGEFNKDYLIQRYLDLLNYIKQDKQENCINIEEEPILIEEPVITEEPIITKEPVITEEPIITKEPVITVEPVITEKPVITEEPIITEKVLENNPPKIVPKKSKKKNKK